MNEHIEFKVVAFRKELEKEKFKAPDPNTLYERLGTDLLGLLLGNDFVPLADPDVAGELLPKIHKMRLRLIEQTGFVMPNIRVKDSIKIAANEYVIVIRGIPVAKGYFDLYQEGSSSFIDPEWTIFTDTSSKLSLQDQDKITRLDPEKCEIALNGITKHLEESIIQHIDKLLNRLGTLKLMELIKLHDQALVTDIVPDKLLVSDLKFILASLIQEEVSIKDILHIFESIYGPAFKGNTPEEIIEQVRKDFSFAICSKFRDEENNLPAIVISEKHHLLESGEEYLKLLAHIHEHLDKNVFYRNRPCIICPPKIRRQLFEKLRRQIPNIIVLSNEEITPDTKVIALEEL